MLNKILPSVANNNFNGHAIALWGFILFTAFMTWRSIIHMFFEQYGFHEIANFKLLTGEPDPMLLIYRFFSVWGFAQLIFCFVCWIVIFRYRVLIPLMYLFWILEWSVRIFIYPLIREEIAIQGLYTTASTPGVFLAPYITGMLVAFFILSMLERK